MHHGILKRALLGVAALSLLPGAAAAAPPTQDAPSWDEFERSTYQDADGQYIVDGDIPLSGEGALAEFYAALHPQDGGTGDLIANTDAYGDPTLWSGTQAKSLTYCVSDSFGARKQSVVNAMNGGAAVWERASSGIDFRYVPSQDGSCTTRNSSVVFSVEPSSTNAYIARAFFPDSPKSQRNVLVTPSLTTSGWSPASVMGHELGHVLGFRHEHTRPEAGTCFEDDSWVPLTPYDARSIMHYPQCNGASSSLGFSSLDAAGVRSAYGS